MDLERLDEALEVISEGGPELDLSDLEALAICVRAARAYRDLLANGERVEWCKEHAVSTPHGKLYCWLKVIDRKLGEEETPCRIVSKFLVDYPKEAENE